MHGTGRIADSCINLSVILKLSFIMLFSFIMCYCDVGSVWIFLPYLGDMLAMVKGGVPEETGLTYRILTSSEVQFFFVC